MESGASMQKGAVSLDIGDLLECNKCLHSFRVSREWVGEIIKKNLRGRKTRPLIERLKCTICDAKDFTLTKSAAPKLPHSPKRHVPEGVGGFVVWSKTDGQD